MKKIQMLLLATLIIAVSSFAQKGKSYIAGGGELSLPTGDFGKYYKAGVGGYAKALFGVGTAGQVTFTGGYSAFKEAGDWDDYTTSISIIPLLVGYRHNFNGLFVEPQLGYAIYGFKYDGFDGFYTDSDGAFTWSANIGYVFVKQLEVSARYQSGGKKGTNLNLFGLRIGYNFSLGGSK